MKEYKIGTPIKISVPTNYIKSFDLNDVAIAQFNNGISGKYVVIIQTEKVHLTSIHVLFTDIVEAGNYCAKSIYNGLAENEKKSVSQPKQIRIGNNDAVVVLLEGTIIDEGEPTDTDLFYHLTVVETPLHYYQILSWSDLQDRTKNLNEFMNIANSFAEIK